MGSTGGGDGSVKGTVAGGGGGGELTSSDAEADAQWCQYLSPSFPPGWLTQYALVERCCLKFTRTRPGAGNCTKHRRHCNTCEIGEAAVWSAGRAVVAAAAAAAAAGAAAAAAAAGTSPPSVPSNVSSCSSSTPSPDDPLPLRRCSLTVIGGVGRDAGASLACCCQAVESNGIPMARV